MELEIFKKEEDIPHYYGESVLKVNRIILYLVDTKDVSIITNPKIKKIQIYDNSFIKVFFEEEETIVLDIDKIGWLKTHHYIRSAIYHQQECEKLWEYLKDIDMFLVEDWKTKKSFTKLPEEITYDRDFIYVNGKSTHLPFSEDMVSFVIQNKEKWY